MTVELLSRVRNARPRSHRPSKAQLIAEIGKLSDQDFVCSHTYKPIYGAFERTIQWCAPHGTNERGAPCNLMLKHRRGGYYFCPLCASEDVKFWGRSYWRRSHQIPGIFWCSKHELPLNSVTGNDLSIQPHETIDTSCQCTSSHFPEKNTIPARYQILVNSIFEFRTPILLYELVNLLKAKMKKVGYSIRAIGSWRNFLSNTVLSKCSHQWCHDLFPNFAEKTAGRFFHDIDAIETRRHDNAVAYILALAVLYDDPDGAALQLSRLQVDEKDPKYPAKLIDVSCDLLQVI